VGNAPAFATAFAGVDVALWELSQADPALHGPLPPAGTLASCNGAAPVDLSTGAFHCGDTQSGTVTRTLPGTATVTRDSVTDVTIIDPSGASIFFLLGFSAFNPGGSEIGASVDHPLSEFAQFSISVTGPDAADAHGCATSVATPSCGVTAPDESESLLVINGSQVLAYEIKIFAQATVSSVAEPGTLPLVAAGFVGLMGLTPWWRPRRA